MDDPDGDWWVDSFFDVTYTVDVPEVSGVQSVELFYRIDGADPYTSAGVFSGPTFEFDASALAEGTYDLYTIATDAVGNVEPTPGSPDVTVQVDKTAPATHVNDLGPYHIDSFFDVTYTLDLEEGSGVESVDLYYMKEGDADYTLFGTFADDTTPLVFDTAAKEPAPATGPTTSTPRARTRPATLKRSPRVLRITTLPRRWTPKIP